MVVAATPEWRRRLEVMSWRRDKLLGMIVAKVDSTHRSCDRPLPTFASPHSRPSVQDLDILRRSRRSEAWRPHPQTSLLVLQSEGLPEQLGSLQHVEGVPRALRVLEEDEGEVPPLLGFLVSKV